MKECYLAAIRPTAVPLLLVVFLGAACAQDSAVSEQAQRPRVGLALSGGGELF